MIAIIDYGMGNPASIRNMLSRLGHQTCLARTPAEAGSATGIILPGVGAFDEGMRRLHESGWADFLKAEAAGKARPILGICLGMQLLYARSEEGRLPGLGLVAGDVVKFDFSVAEAARLRVPHMGWGPVQVKKDPAGLLAGYESAPRFYFVHSYYCRCAREGDIAAEAVHGHAFTCAVQAGSLFGVQFHPEKSHRYGMRLLGNFVGLAR